MITRIGIVGCGNISSIYFTNLTKRFPWVTVVACSDLSAERSLAKAQEFNIASCTTEELLARKDIDIVVNLTTPELHAKVNSMVMSFDVWASTVPRIEIHGTKGSLLVPDPNGFGGPVKIRRHNDTDWVDVSLSSHSYGDNSRGIGVADMALAIQNKRPLRASGIMAAHILDVMVSFEESSKNGKAIHLTSTCDKPMALPAGLVEGKEW